MTNPPEFQVSSGGAIALPQPVAVARKTPRQLFWERFRQDKAALAGGVVVVLLVVIAFFGGPLAVALTGHSPNEIVPNSTDDYGVPFGPNGHLWFGADAEGRDLFVRTMYGARISLFVGIVASGLALLIGLVVGLAAGFFGGWVDTTLSRSADVLLEDGLCRRLTSAWITGGDRRDHAVFMVVHRAHRARVHPFAP
jgi:peptide/nickel transport system permease protein